MFSRFDTIPECDRHTQRGRQTHMQTHDDNIYSASIVSHGKNRRNWLRHFQDISRNSGPLYLANPVYRDCIAVLRQQLTKWWEGRKPWRRNDEVCFVRHTARHHQRGRLGGGWCVLERRAVRRWWCKDGCQRRDPAAPSRRHLPLNSHYSTYVTQLTRSTNWLFADKNSAVCVLLSESLAHTKYSRIPTLW